MKKTKISSISFVFYSRENPGVELQRATYSPSVTPPVPSEGDAVCFQGKPDLAFLVDEVVHYYEGKTVEIAILVRQAHLEEDPEPEPQEEEKTGESSSPSGVPLDAQGNCAYCHDPDCVGGEDCNFYDGSLD